MSGRKEIVVRLLLILSSVCIISCQCSGQDDSLPILDDASFDAQATDSNVLDARITDRNLSVSDQRQDDHLVPEAAPDLLKPDTFYKCIHPKVVKKCKKDTLGIT